MAEAIKFEGNGDSCGKVSEFIGAMDPKLCVWKSCTYDGGYITTANGVCEFRRGDWIIKDSDGSFDVAIPPHEYAKRDIGSVRYMMVAWIAGEISEGKLSEITGLDRMCLRLVRDQIIKIGAEAAGGIRRHI